MKKNDGTLSVTPYHKGLKKDIAFFIWEINYRNILHIFWFMLENKNEFFSETWCCTLMLDIYKL